ncbi:MAG: hypothetical protein U9R08_07250 [Nanoarchaeota archaeon]|nr:hypothetical protein [Nanoarchaeota archaeon]
MKNKKFKQLSHAKVLVLVSIAFLIIAAVFVSAEYTSVPKGGHTADKIVVLDKDGVQKSLQQSIDEQTLSSGFDGGIIEADAGIFSKSDDGCNAGYVNIWDSSDNRGWQLVNRQAGCGVANDALNFFFYDGAAWLHRMTMLPDGNVGIGTGNPAAKLETNLVNSDGWSGNTKALRISSPDNNYYLDLDTYVVGAGNVGYHFSPNNNAGLVVTTPGDVGIGTTAPGAKLDVQGNLKVVNHYFDADDDSWLRLRTSNGGAYKDLAVGQLYSATGITLGGVHRNSWPSGCELAWVGSTSYAFVPMNVPSRCSSGCELKIFYTPYTAGISAVTYLRYSGNTWISETGGGTNGDITPSLIASLARLWLYDDYSATETSSTQWTVRTQTGITGYIYAC